MEVTPETLCPSLDEDTKVSKSTDVVLEHANVFTCKMSRSCKQSFRNVTDYERHEITHTKKDINQTMSSCNAHDTDRFIKRFECKECGQKFVHENTLTDHSVVHEPFTHVCDCGIGFYQEMDLTCHKKLVHLSNTAQRPKIRLKPKNVPNTIELESQTGSARLIPSLSTTLIYSNTMIDPNQKDISDTIKLENEPESAILIPRMTTTLTCNKPMFNLNSKDIPGTIKLENETEPALLNPVLSTTITCSKPRQRRRRRTVPLKIPTNENDQFYCPICKKVMASKKGVQVHILTHTGEKPHKCDKCDKRFTQHSSLALHQRKHTGLKDFKCKFCKKGFYTLFSLQLHERTHTGEKPYTCKYCEKAFSAQSALNRHLRMHTGDKPYKCPHCPMTFKDSSNLMVHKVQHEGKTKQCHVCMKMFHLQHQLNRHLLTVHSKERFECNVCNKKFREKSNFKKHYNDIHLGIRKFECDYCGFRQSEKHKLQRHILKKHMKS